MPTLDTPLEHSPEGACLKSAYETLLTLELPSVVSVVMKKRLSAMETIEDPPYVMLCPVTEAISPNDGNNERDAIQYVVMVAIVAASNRDDSIDTAGWLLYCEWLITRAFNHKTSADLVAPSMPTGAMLIYTTVEPGAKFIEPAARMNYDAAYVLIRFHTQQTRA